VAVHRVHLSGPKRRPGDEIEIAGPEAHHAVRVKRLDSGDPLELLDGRGWRGAARVVNIAKAAKGEWVLRAVVTEATEEPEPMPRVHVLAAAPKGPRLEEMIDQLSQVGAASWSPLVTRHTVVSPREGKLLKAERVAAEAAKQCGRAWTLAIGSAVQLSEALARPGTRLVLADAAGRRYAAEGAPDITLLVGPEGGFAEDEIREAASSDARICRFGSHVMRVETAAVVGAAIILDAACS
jgi:16S rRNA (uracil1498-N3)-methyltransferase